MTELIQKISTTIDKLANLDVGDSAIPAIVEGLNREISLLNELHKEVPKDSISASSMQSDIENLHEQIGKLHSAAVKPLHNYQRIVSTLESLKRILSIAERPQNAEIRPKIAAATQKIAGIFSAIDTAEDLDRPLSEIEEAVHKLYRGQSKNSDFYPHRNGKGHQ